MFVLWGAGIKAMGTSKLVTLAATNFELDDHTRQTKNQEYSEDIFSRRFSWLGSSHGFHEYAVIGLDRDERGQMVPEILQTSFQPEFLMNLGDAGDMGTCSLFSQLGVSTIPFGWDVGAVVSIDGSAEPQENLADEEFDLLLESEGIGGGYCVPVHAPDNRRAVVVYFSKSAQSQRHFAALVLSTLLLFDEFRSFAAENKQTLMELPPYEIDLLRGLACGRSISELAISKGYSEHTINLYLNHLKLKLGVSTLVQAVAKSRSIGLLLD